MAVIMDNGVLPASKDCAAEVIYEGKVYKYDSSGTSPNTITSSQKHTRHLKHLAKTQQEWAEYLQSKKALCLKKT